MRFQPQLRWDTLTVLTGEDHREPCKYELVALTEATSADGVYVIAKPTLLLQL